MKKSLLLIGLFLSLMNFAQVRFEKGYIIDNNDQRKECLIKNEDLIGNPTSFEYKLNEESPVQIGNVNNVKSFEIYNKVKFISETVDVDNSSNDLQNLSTVRAPEYTKEKVFLKVVVNGKYNLYEYSSGGRDHYFFNTTGSLVKPLVYKSYSFDQSKVAYNETYRDTLREDLKCDGFAPESINKVDYSKRSLSGLFQKINQCADPNYKVVITEQKKAKFNLYVRPQVNSSSLQFTNGITPEGLKMDTKTGLGGGIELEYVLAVNGYKWSFFAAPNYFSYKAKSSFERDYLSGGKVITDVEYKSVDIPLGARRYFYLDSKSKIFIDAAFIPNFSFGSSFEQHRESGGTLKKSEIDPKFNYSFGVGYNYNNKFTVEANYKTPRSIFKDDGTVTSKFNMVSLVIGYNIF